MVSARNSARSAPCKSVLAQKYFSSRIDPGTRLRQFVGQHDGGQQQHAIIADQPEFLGDGLRALRNVAGQVEDTRLLAVCAP
jgi:hypothetical protein